MSETEYDSPALPPNVRGNPNMAQYGQEHRITSANSRLLAAKRWARFRTRVNERLALELKDFDPMANEIIAKRGEYTADDAAAFVTVKKTVDLLDAQGGRMDDVYRLQQIRGGIPLPGEMQAQAVANQPPTQVNVAVVVASSVAERVLQQILATQGSVVDADSNDG